VISSSLIHKRIATRARLADKSLDAWLQDLPASAVK
jgi:hypothetical protein